MPSMKCYQCGKVKKTKMVTVPGTREGDVIITMSHVEYLCAPCRRELGYT